MDLSAAGAAVSVVEAETLPKVAEMFEDCPAGPAAVASPAALIEAAVVFEEAHVTVAVMSLVLASE